MSKIIALLQRVANEKSKAVRLQLLNAAKSLINVEIRRVQNEIDESRP